MNLQAFIGDWNGLLRGIHILARANYRQTLVNLNDGILQPSWHQNQEFLRLCGMGLTGIVTRPDLGPYEYRMLRMASVHGAYSMADELGMQRPKNVTTVKPSGSLSKCCDTTEGCHKPLGRYIFNNVNFGKHDPLLDPLRDAGYFTRVNPADPDGVLVTFPVEWPTVPFNDQGYNLESALDQLERYKMLMENYVDQNCSITVSYDSSEVPGIIDWLLANWDTYVGVSFLPRVDPTKTAKDLGYLYLPQEVVTKEAYEEYIKSLRPVSLGVSEGDMIDTQECAGGACPIR